MVKIDVEGLEFKVLNSVLSCSLPLIIQIEANINNSILINHLTQLTNC